MEATMPIWQVCAMGVGIVFFGLVCLIIMCYIIGSACTVFVKKQVEEPIKNVGASTAPSKMTAEEKRETVAAISAAVAEEMGTDVSAIRIKSIKRI